MKINNADLCNFRGISRLINAPQAHLKIIPLHVYNSSYRPEEQQWERPKLLGAIYAMGLLVLYSFRFNVWWYEYIEFKNTCNVNLQRN